MSESEYPFEIFLWEAEVKEDINPELIFRKVGYSLNTSVEFVELDSFFELAATEQSWHSTKEKETVKRYQNLVKLIKANLADVKVARLGTITIDVYIVGRTPSGDLAGLTTKVVET